MALSGIYSSRSPSETDPLLASSVSKVIRDTNKPRGDKRQERERPPNEDLWFSPSSCRRYKLSLVASMLVMVVLAVNDSVVIISLVVVDPSIATSSKQEIRATNALFLIHNPGLFQRNNAVATKEAVRPSNKHNGSSIPLSSSYMVPTSYPSNGTCLYTKIGAVQ
eukprot:CAMPEP_0178779212 /NCGR_PEP_ID=MMETSP0745-20121128/1403_1 /TAXON_ID=913974 /ORGANISM="Nitzschia punctata, Strain CCMP561" /LENGTH=164 /DNA_ID=CAMNT_0020436385 /DNA_START=254 /DNA_END=745 /DNA_ORIENTATION=+